MTHPRKIKQSLVTGGILGEAEEFCLVAAIAIQQHFTQIRCKYVGLEQKFMIATHTVQRFL